MVKFCWGCNNDCCLKCGINVAQYPAELCDDCAKNCARCRSSQVQLYEKGSPKKCWTCGNPTFKACIKCDKFI